MGLQPAKVRYPVKSLCWVWLPDYVTPPQPHPISYWSALLHSSITLAKNNSWKCSRLIQYTFVCVRFLRVWCLQEEMRQSVAPAEPVQYYFTLAQQPGAVQVQGTQQGQQAGAQTATTIQPGQIIITQPQQGQVRSSPCLRALGKICHTSHHIREEFISGTMYSSIPEFATRAWWWSSREMIFANKNL